jgi:hypothetical protein
MKNLISLYKQKETLETRVVFLEEQILNWGADGFTDIYNSREEYVRATSELEEIKDHLIKLEEKIEYELGRKIIRRNKNEWS